MISSRTLRWLGGAVLAGLLVVAVLQAPSQLLADSIRAWPLVSLALVLGGGVVLFGVFRHQERVRSQLTRLGEEVRHLNKNGDRSRRLTVEGRGEAAELATSFNKLLDALEDAQQYLQRECAETQALRRATARISEFFHAFPVPHGICELNTGRFVEASDGLLALLGYARNEVVGRTDLDLQVWAEPHARASWWDLVKEKGSVRDVECQLCMKSGEQCHVALSAETLVFDGEACVLVTVHDLTERLTRELRVRQMQKMDAMGRLAAGFAHDFNNILCIVQGYTNLLLSDSRLEGQQQGFLKQVGQAAERGAHLTRQLLVFGRKQMMKPHTVDLNQVLHGLSNMLLRVLGEDVALKFNFAAIVPPVQVDTGMLEQLIMNLAMNARDAMSQGGQLTISTSARTIDQGYVRRLPEAREGAFACLTVSDTGQGMDPAALGRLFEPFFSTKDVGKGTGLGLATVYGIVKQHHGWIDVASQPGKGTSFQIFLPACQIRAESPVPQPTSAPQTGGHEKILAVEDEPALLALMQSVLQSLGYEVISATNGVNALRVWEEHQGRVDLLVTDIVMPEGMTGRELAEKLRIRRPALKVIYTSGYSADLVGVTTEELVEGMNFIQKPYRPNSLAQTVRNCLDANAASESHDGQQAAA